ncbi:microtubule associated protein [Pseudohyphozyma bogoriensis]|nr:microtubule associated protein [Pseudohyphozyma bogoriensis]
MHTLYSSLSPSPAPLLQAALSPVQSLLQQTLDDQIAEATAKVDAVKSQLDDAWKRVFDWRTALGEQVGERSGVEGPLETQLEGVGKVLDGMKGRTEERGKAVMRVQTKLSKLVDEQEGVLEKEWLEVELEDLSSGWEGLDLRLERLSALEREVMRCETEIAHRRSVISANVTEIFTLRTELGIHQNSSLPISHDHDTDTANAPVPDEFDEAVLAHLGVGEEREKKELKPTRENLLRVEAKRQWLEEEKNHRNMLIQTTYDKLYPLWTMLGVSEVEMEDFVNQWMGSTSDAVTAVCLPSLFVSYPPLLTLNTSKPQYKTELHRMLQLKRSNLSSFILSEREALTALWDTLYLSPPQRIASFPPFNINVLPTKVWNPVHGAEEEVVNENVSEELLVAHERERERVEQEVEAMKPVLGRLGKYFELVEELRELEASAADPSRLLGKSTRGDPGRLLREEKARKRVATLKPKLESELRVLIPNWEEEHGRPFLVNGSRFLDDLEAKLEAEAAEKESKKRSKTGSSASTSSRTTTAPLRAQMTGSSTVSTVPIKRQMTGGASMKTASTPASKRQVPMHTGGSTARPLVRSHTGGASASSSRVLGDIVNGHGPAAKLFPQATGRSAGGGMKIPAGFGSESMSSSSYEQQSLGSPTLQAQGQDAFKPRSSALSTASGSGSSLWSHKTASTMGTSVDGGC